MSAKSAVWSDGRATQSSMTASRILRDLSLEELPPSKGDPSRLFQNISYHPSSTSLTYRLPNEILSHIFLFAAHGYSEPNDAILTPITLSHVSSHWRQVALLTGRLWTNFTVNFPVSCAQLSRCMVWLIRSRHYPIDILFDFRDPSWDWEEASHKFRWQDMEAILRIFLVHVERWRTIELLTDTWAPIFTFLWYSGRVGSAPLLERISISRCNAYFAMKGETFQPAALGAPISLFGGRSMEKLRTVTLVGVHVDWPRSSLRDLTTLEFKYHSSDVMPSLGQFVKILNGCPKLQQLSIIGWGPQLQEKSAARRATDHEAGLLASTTIHLPCLKRFALGFVDTAYAVKLLSLFSLPELDEFLLEDVFGSLKSSEYQDATPVLDWLSTRNDSMGSATQATLANQIFPLCNILSLQLYTIHSDESTFSRFFKKLGLLRHLDLFDTPDSPLHAITPSAPSETPPCPLLKELNCRGVGPDALARAIAARTLDEKALLVRDDGSQLTPEDRNTLTDLGVEILHV